MQKSTHRGKGSRRGPVALLLLGGVVLGSVTMAYAAPDKPSKPDVIYRDGKKIHRGKLAETTNDKVVNGFPISELPRVPAGPGGEGGSGGDIVGPRCAHTKEGGSECSIPSPEEVKRDYAFYYEPNLKGEKKAAAERNSPRTIPGAVGPEPERKAAP